MNQKCNYPSFDSPLFNSENKAFTDLTQFQVQTYRNFIKHMHDIPLVRISLILQAVIEIMLNLIFGSIK